MGADSNKSSLACNILVELVLKRDKRLIARLREFDISKYSTRYVGSYSGSLITA